MFKWRKKETVTQPKGARMLTNRVLLILALCAMGGLAYFFLTQISTIKTKQNLSTIENVKTNQFLMSTINWSNQRQKTILFMRDQIIDEWTRISEKPDFDRAYQKSEAIMKECERYPNLKPFLLLAVQWRESSFLDSTRDSSGSKCIVKSYRGAQGSWQFVQSTARLLCEALGISYSDKIYTDVSLSTRLAAKYFDILWATYGNDTLSCVDYNGGPIQVQYYLYDKGKLADETKIFAKDVTAKAAQYSNDFLLYRIEKTITIK